MPNVNQLGDRVEAAISALRAHMGADRPEGVWSSVQTLDHLAQVHRGLLLGLRAQEPLPKRAFYFRVRCKMVAFILSQAIPVPAKGALPTCPADADFEAMAEDFRQIHAKLANRATEASGQNFMAMNHPVAGPLTLEEAMTITDAHLVYHIKRAGK